MKWMPLYRAIAFAFFCALLFPALAWATSERPIVVSMGDSYSSGESIEPFYGQSEARCYGDQDWLAHRSEGSWPGQLVVDGVPLSKVRADPSNETVYKNGVIRFSYNDWSDGSWYFVASSGAETRHVLGRGKDGGRQKKGTMARRDGRVGPGILTYHDASLAPQIEVFDYLDQKYGEGAVDYVSISIGGNDVGFTDIIIDAVTTSGWADPYALYWQLQHAREDFERDARDDIADVYKEVYYAAGPQAKVIAAGYPALFDGATRGFGISKYEMGLINETAEWLDEQLAALVDEVASEVDPGTEWLHYVSVVEAFRGRGAYTANEYINRIIVPPGKQDIPGTKVASAYSIHPNDRGAAAYATTVQDVIDLLEAKKVASVGADIANRLADGSFPVRSGASRDALAAYQAFLSDILNQCGTTFNGYPAISHQGHGEIIYEYYYAFAVGYFGDDIPYLLVCSGNENDLGMSYTNPIVLYGYDRSTGSVVEKNNCSTLEYLVDAQFYEAPPESDDQKMGEVELFFDGQGSSVRNWLTGNAFDEALYGNYLSVERNDDGSYEAWVCGGFAADPYGIQPLDPLEGKSLFERDYLTPRDTSFYEFNDENIKSLL